jgi:hypothetical protein
MATVFCNGGSPATGNLSNAQTGNGVSTNIIDRGAFTVGPALLRIVTAIGATPTCTYLVEGSANGTDWFPAPIADPSAPETVTVATFTITTATTTLKILRQNHPWRFLRITYSANTNVTNTADLWPF